MDEPERDGRESFAATQIEPLLDDELWQPLLQAVGTAKRRLDLSQLLFETSFRPLAGGPVLARELEAAAERGARVRVLVNENAAVPDSYDELRARFEGTRVTVGSLPMSPNVMHAKLLVADDEAFLVDAPFEQKYADTRAHAFDSEHRRGHMPFHSVSLRLRGAVVERLAQLFDALWRRAPLPPASERATGDDVQLARTAPAGVWSEAPAGGVLAAYERALGEARRWVYVETQYLTSPRIVRAISSALAREPELEVILVLNETMDIPTYDAWQRRRLAELGFPDHPRLGVFSLWAPRRADDRAAARRVYVHSKVCIVDDAWATLGSANLDSISLHEAEEFGFVAPRNVEVNAVLRRPDLVASLRRRLWSEHLGDAGVWSAAPPAGGWLARWRAAAERNLASFRAGEPHGPGRVMPYDALPTSGREGISRASAAPS